MENQNKNFNADWPAPPADADNKNVVLHTRVVSETGGGPEKTILLSSPFLADSDYWLASAYMHPPECPGFETIKKRAQEWNSPLIALPDKGVKDVSLIRKYRKILKHYDVKIWHAHDYKSNLLGLMLRPFHKMKLVTTVHGWVVQTSRTPFYYKVDKWSIPYYNHVICVSDDLQDEARRIGVKEEKLSWIRNAIDEKDYDRKYPAAESDLRDKMKTPKGRLVIGAVGRLMPEKGFNHLIRAAQTLINEGYDIEVWIAGKGNSHDDLQKMIIELNLQDRVKLFGFCSDMIGFYHALDMYVLSSLREGLPNVVLEACSMRVPVVSTLVAGIPKMLTDGINGMLCPIADIEKLTDAMRKVVKNPDLRENLSQAGRKLIEEEYTFKARMNKVKAIYDKLLRDNKTSAVKEKTVQIKISS